MYRGFVLAAADPGLTAGLGPFAAPLSQPVSCHTFSCPVNKAKGQTKKKKKGAFQNQTSALGSDLYLKWTLLPAFL